MDKAVSDFRLRIERQWLLLFAVLWLQLASPAFAQSNRYESISKIQVETLSTPPAAVPWGQRLSDATIDPVPRLDADIAASLPQVSNFEILPFYPEVSADVERVDLAGVAIYGQATSATHRQLQPGAGQVSLLGELSALLTQPLLRYPQRRSLNLDEAVYAAIDFAPEIDILRASVAVQELEVTRERSQFDWATFVRNNWDENNRPVGSGLDGAANRSITHSWTSSYGANRRNILGGSLQLAQDLGISDSNSSFFTPQNQATAKVALQYEQPLLQGAGKLVNTSRIEIAIARLVGENETLVAGLQDHILGVTSAYWTLVEKRGELLIQSKLVARAEETANKVRNRLNVDIGPIQSVRTEATVRSRQAALSEAEYAVVLAQDELLRRIFGARFQDSANNELIVSAPLEGASREVDIAFEVDRALRSRAEIKRSLQEIRTASIERGVAQNQLLPALGLTLSLSNQGLQGNRALASALNDQYNLGDPTYGVGLEYNFPVGNRANRANLRQAELRLRSIQRQFETVVSNVVLDVRRASHNLVLRDAQRAQRREALEQAVRELDIITIRTESLIDGQSVGPLYVDTLLAAQDRLASAERAYLLALTSYARSQFELQRANGTLLQSEPLPSQ